MRDDKSLIERGDYNMDDLYMNTTKQLSEKDLRDYEQIANNMELLKAFMGVFKGQALLLDFRDFCLKFNICMSESDFDYAIEKLIKNKILKKKVFAGTTNTVLIAKTCVNRTLIGVNDSIDYSHNQVKLNCFKNYLIVNNFSRKNENLDSFIDRINKQSTFLYVKNDVDKAYNFFDSKLSVNEIGENSFKCARYMKTKGLKQVGTIGSEDDKMKGYTNSFDTFVNKFVYTLYTDNKFIFYILDLDNSMVASRVANCIGTIVGTLYEQVEQVDLYSKLENVEFVVVTKDKTRVDKIWNSFRKEYNKETFVHGIGIKTIKAHREFLLDCTRRALNKRVNNIKIRYTDVDKSSTDIITFKNSNPEYGLNATIRVLDADLNSRLNLDNKVTMLKQNAQDKYVKSVQAKYKKQMEEEIANIKAIYSATEQEIRAEIKREYGIYDGFANMEEQEELELIQYYERNNLED